MPSSFVPLAVWLRPTIEQEVPALAEPSAVEEAPAAEPADQTDAELVLDICARVRRFRAMLDDALEHCVQELLREIAVDVVGRELQSAPADIDAIVRRARERCSQSPPLAVRVHPSQAQLLRLDVPVLADPRLRSEDVMIDVHAGSIDATLGVRIERLLEEFDR
ncbi:MAG TPA: FliH/SctL family protein [Candidatus Baltobacteraceae bacterium]|nr:FliH/SctL family protein [Candidatus Baltobacteraceae bacterium]